MTILVWVLVLPAFGWAILRLGGAERGPLVQLFAFTAYAAVWSVWPLLLALITQRWAAAAVALAAALILIAAVLPRAMPSRDRGPAGGVALQVLSANMLMGGADPEAIVALVREHDVAVLALQEFTHTAQAALAKAGLDELLPYSSLTPQALDSPRATIGSAFYSRFPIAGIGLRQLEGGDRQAYGTIRPPGAAPVLVESAHPAAPWHVRANREWRRDLADEPGADPTGPARILLGDFNATLDHAPLRKLIARGYRDAAATAGQGLIGTWGPYTGKLIPPVTIDHILVDRRIAVDAVSVHGIPQSDHRAVMATLRIPVS
jgi:endonuclease/exonuclease/phosphatase family metal-dependent hydrolase